MSRMVSVAVLAVAALLLAGRSARAANISVSFTEVDSTTLTLNSAGVTAGITTTNPSPDNWTVTLPSNISPFFVGEQMTRVEPGATDGTVNQGDAPSAVPEPASLFLLGGGVVGLTYWLRRRRSRTNR